MDLTDCFCKLRRCDRLLEGLGKDVSVDHLESIYTDLDECSECLMNCEQEFVLDTRCLLSYLLVLKHYRVPLCRDMLVSVFDFKYRTSQLIQDVLRIKTIIKIFIELYDIDRYLAMTAVCQDVIEDGIVNIGFVSSVLGYEPTLFVTVLSMVDFSVVIDDLPLVFHPSKIRFLGDKLGSGVFRCFNNFFFRSGYYCE
uniref:P22 n=1 Tax=Tomato chlorosis virus TaxID=67754 RepID=A0A218MJ14_9CLOS|nr:P22 protein [Tomato chlorosis virus]AXF74711.1 P22 [Tomato chlorosis virus]